MFQLLNNLYAGLLPDDIVSPEDFCDNIMKAIAAQPDTHKRAGVISSKNFVHAAMLTSVVRQLADAVVRGAMMPYEQRRERTGSYGRPRAESVRRKSVGSHGGASQERHRRTTIS